MRTIALSVALGATLILATGCGGNGAVDVPYEGYQIQVSAPEFPEVTPDVIPGPWGRITMKVLNNWGQPEAGWTFVIRDRITGAFVTALEAGPNMTEVLFERHTVEQLEPHTKLLTGFGRNFSVKVVPPGMAATAENEVSHLESYVNFAELGAPIGTHRFIGYGLWEEHPVRLYTFDQNGQLVPNDLGGTLYYYRLAGGGEWVFETAESVPAQTTEFMSAPGPNAGAYLLIFQDMQGRLSQGFIQVRLDESDIGGGLSDNCVQQVVPQGNVAVTQFYRTVWPGNLFFTESGLTFTTLGNMTSVSVPFPAHQDYMEVTFPHVGWHTVQAYYLVGEQNNPGHFEVPFLVK